MGQVVVDDILLTAHEKEENKNEDHQNDMSIKNILMKYSEISSEGIQPCPESIFLKCLPDCILQTGSSHGTDLGGTLKPNHRWIGGSISEQYMKKLETASQLEVEI